ncbi:YitT family protein [Bacillus shivajii]|uniref:YczE/YyaS/YitT family protein n=1 Tax=Bacillus shivajii TaxID=1983719 RepID=UPI001CFB7316|nr:YitT family protein [Bacillus shivajii]UCZ54376.1 YitT family protein [Bacillus shivajii]
MNKFFHQDQWPMMYRWSIYFIGLIIMSFGIALTIRGDLGSAPWDVLHIGLTNQFGLTVGSWTIIMGFLLLVLSTLLTKEWPKLGAYLNMVFVGVFVDIFLFFLQTPSTLLFQVIMLVLGITIMGFGIGVYISPRCGAGPRDSLMLAVSKKTGMSVANVRIAMEMVVLVVGWQLGGPVFIGTLLFCLTIGHVAGYSLNLCEKWYDRRMERGMNVENIN